MSQIADDDFVFPLMDCCESPSLDTTDDGNREQICSNCKTQFNADNFTSINNALQWLMYLRNN